MEYNLIIHDHEITVDATPTGDQTMTLVIGDVDYDVRSTRINEHQLHLSVNGVGSTVFVSRNGSTKTIMINGSSMDVEDRDHPSLSKSGRKRSSAIPDSVTPPMPAVVIAILVKNGDTVVKGQGVVVVSAMKMETTLSAPYDGIVKEIRTTEGSKVSPGDILVEIEKSDD